MRPCFAIALTCFACSSNESTSPAGTGGAAGTGQSGAGQGGAAANGGAAGTAGAGGSISYPPAYSIDAFDDVRISSDSSQEHFQSATVEIDFADAPFEKATLVVDLASTCFPFEKWQSNPPPSNHNWPADCDAFDRNFEFSLDDPENDGEPPGLELQRAITPFGGPLHFETDVTDVANGLPGKHRLKVHISTWSDGDGLVSGSNGGWNVMAKLDMVPGPAPREVLAVVPLFDGSQGSPDPIDAVPFTTPAGTKSARLEYRVTGHGGVTFAPGCAALAPAEEFCLRTHTLYVDEQVLDVMDPWRDDCDTLCTLKHQGPQSGGFDYCLENPCGAIDSVKAPRSNWCPGSLTPPFTWDSDALHTPGDHDFRWTISNVASGGSWRVSATYFAFGG